MLCILNAYNNKDVNYRQKMSPFYITLWPQVCVLSILGWRRLFECHYLCLTVLIWRKKQNKTKKTATTKKEKKLPKHSNRKKIQLIFGNSKTRRLNPQANSSQALERIISKPVFNWQCANSVVVIPWDERGWCSMSVWSSVFSVGPQQSPPQCTRS